jgi:site-specific DNA-cytosine methylase
VQATKQAGLRLSRQCWSTKLIAVRVLELFAGIGGLHAACPWLTIATAVDINRDSEAVYSRNFSVPYLMRELETIPQHWLATQKADLWWMSPPCAPFTRKGERRDIHDVRTRALLHLIDAVARIRPAYVVLENVVGFENSHTFQRLSDVWQRSGYHLQVHSLCPTQTGWPNRRPRVYVIATQGTVPLIKVPELTRSKALRDLLVQYEADTAQREGLSVSADIVSKYGAALDVVDVDDSHAVAACFGSSYGRAITKSGSYIATEYGLRRFSPREVANILGFPQDFVLPDHVPTRRLWQLLGNSLSLPAVAHIMQFTRS